MSLTAEGRDKLEDCLRSLQREVSCIKFDGEDDSGSARAALVASVAASRKSALFLVAVS